MGNGNNHDSCEPGKGGLSVRVHEGQFEKAMKVFKKKVMNDGILKELKARQAYEKPGEIRRRKAAEARRRHLKQLALNKRFEN